MNAVHTRGHYEMDEPVFDRFWQLDVRVMKQNGNQQKSLPAEQHLRVNTDQQDLRESVRNRQCNLSEVEAERGRSIEIEINMMHGVKAP